ncbi:hypothetical protein GLOTRDRAFT_48828 [Gloeophyllum trabeum ATCC 11539]|uniref:Uncharacterized protein n=1 Tax=Gloeophyllum trabeum (strain ATCC 11539 / FP-39264 / Madison 617) TaxID=670483 RepID=S7RGE4_GLOTA|nr:uncharacterized protein GLOTRDRAFT_48828 [Gloeophyllum trabeum ATCC 11539]EPQ51609.1 hypothetical protein GLOTRDRAFT_48828 [Gloeophyllum trabeum ATCC 11539]
MKAPEGKLGMFLWRRRMWLEATFGTSLLEPWEKMTLVVIWSLLMTLIVTGAVKYLPQHLYFIQRRAVYYIVGREGDIQDLVHDGWASGEHPEL